MKNNPELNKKCGNRLRAALKAKNIMQKEFAKKDGVNFTEQYISEICNGKKYIGTENAHNFAKILNIRPEYLLGIDEYMTIEEMRQAKKDSFFESVGSFVMSEDIDKKMERIERIIKLGEIGEQLQKIYGVPDGWDELPIENGMNFTIYLDEQISHAFNTYFKYFQPTIDEPQQSDSIDGFGIVVEEVLETIQETVPNATTLEQIFQAFDSKNNVNDFKKKLRKKLRKDGE